MIKRFNLQETTLIFDQITKSIKTEDMEEKRWALKQWQALKTWLEKSENNESKN